MSEEIIPEIVPPPVAAERFRVLEAWTEAYVREETVKKFVCLNAIRLRSCCKLNIYIDL